MANSILLPSSSLFHGSICCYVSLFCCPLSAQSRLLTCSHLDTECLDFAGLLWVHLELLIVMFLVYSSAVSPSLVLSNNLASGV